MTKLHQKNANKEWGIKSGEIHNTIIPHNKATPVVLPLCIKLQLRDKETDAEDKRTYLFVFVS